MLLYRLVMIRSHSLRLDPYEILLPFQSPITIFFSFLPPDQSRDRYIDRGMMQIHDTNVVDISRGRNVKYTLSIAASQMLITVVKLKFSYKTMYNFRKKYLPPHVLQTGVASPLNVRNHDRYQGNLMK